MFNTVRSYDIGIIDLGAEMDRMKHMLEEQMLSTKDVQTIVRNWLVNISEFLKS